MQVAEYFKAIVGQALAAQASDIHLEPLAQQGTLRFRTDGVLQVVDSLEKTFFLSLLAHIKVLADLNVSERQLPQDGRLVLDLPGQDLDIRVSTLPTQAGECVTLRLLDKKDFFWKVEDLRLPAGVFSALEELTQLASGLIVVSGPTGSGKTTTIYSLLRQLSQRGEHKILTLEDPVEYALDGIQQVSIQPELGLSFSSGLRSFLRQDPNILFVGEIRDSETARVVIQAALTGHLVFTTLHTQDSITVIHRLMHLGIEPFLISASLRGVLAQRLVRRLCSSCKELASPSKAGLAYPQSLQSRAYSQNLAYCSDLTYSSDLVYFSGLAYPQGLAYPPPTYQALGCPACKYSGFQGRLPLFEWLRVDASLKPLIDAQASYVHFQQALAKRGFVSLEDTAKIALNTGKTSLSEVQKFFKPL